MTIPATAKASLRAVSSNLNAVAHLKTATGISAHVDQLIRDFTALSDTATDVLKSTTPTVQDTEAIDQGLSGYAASLRASNDDCVAAADMIMENAHILASVTADIAKPSFGNADVEDAVSSLSNIAAEVKDLSTW